MPSTEEEKKERKRIYQKKYREKNRKRKLEKQREYDKAHKKEKAVYDKEYRQTHKQKIKEYVDKHKEKKREYNKEYCQTPAGKKSYTISRWKQWGLICDDYDSLYAHYIVAEICDECNMRFGEKGDGSGTFRCMDHDHETGEFRNFLCNKCNLARGP